MHRVITRGILPLAVLATAALVSRARAGSRVEQLQPETAVPSAETGVLTNETPRFWFVEYPSAPLADGNSDAALDNEHAAFRKEAAAKNVRFSERMRFKSLWNGISVEAKSSDIAQIRQFASVKAVYPVMTHAMPRTETVSPDLATAIQMTRADIAQNELGLSGRGVRVAVMDTGIDYDNPDLGPGFGPGHRVTTGWDFVGDAYNADPTSPTFDPTPHPDPDPDDCAGHGTHVAGIIGAMGNNSVGVVGVAWGVQIMACKFIDSQGNGSISDAITCLDYARAHAAKVVNASWGGYGFTSAALRDAINNLRDAGIIIVTAAGNNTNNNDANPLFPASYEYDNNLAVAATNRTDTRLSLRLDQEARHNLLLQADLSWLKTNYRGPVSHGQNTFQARAEAQYLVDRVFAPFAAVGVAAAGLSGCASLPCFLHK